MNRIQSNVAWAIVFGLCLLAISIAAPGHTATAASPSDTVADRVFGQAGSFTSNTCNLGGLGAASLCGPRGEAVDAAGNVYVAEYNNNRVLEYDTPLTTDTVADRVFGQAGSFTSNTCNLGGLGAASLCTPIGVAVDTAGNLYVGDNGNSRIVEYDTPLTTDSVADRVFGQAGFTNGNCNRGLANPSASSLCDGGLVTVDAGGNLYEADSGNNRVLEYNTPLTTNTVADRVFGQAGSFTSKACNLGGVSASSLCDPTSVSVDASGNLLVPDFGNNRVLEYDTPLTTNTVADRVFGQAGSFTSNSCNLGGVSASSLCNPIGVAVDADGNLYVAEYNNNRVLEYNTPLTTNTVADRVFGQAGSFTSNSCNLGGVSASSLCNPDEMAVDAAGNLYVTDSTNMRVLEYDTASLNSTVFGGPAANPESPTAADDPVNLATGNFSYQHTDVSIPGKGPLSFTRTYNDQDATAGRLGVGWLDNLAARLLFSDTNHATANVTVVTEEGRQDRYLRQGDASYHPPTGIFDVLTRNSGDGTFTLRRKDRSQLHFDANGVLTSANDGNGNTDSLTYSSGRLVTVTDPSGQTLNFSYDGNGRITTIAYPVARTTTYAYDANGNLVSVTDPMGHVESYTYDANHHLLTITDPLGHIVMTKTYDSSGRVTQNTNALGQNSSYSYSTGQATNTDTGGCVASHTYDQLLRETQRTDCLTGGTATYTYDSAGNRTSATDQLGRTTTSAYDARGNLTSQTDPAAGVTTFTYNAQDDLLAATDPLGHTTTLTYDANGNELTRTDPASGITSSTYDSAGLVLSQTDPLGHTTFYAYDANGNRTSSTDPLGNTTSSTYDSTNRLTSETDPLGHTTSYTYDANEQLLTTTDPLGHTASSAYDSNGNRTSETDANGKVTSYNYDASNQVTKVTDPAGGMTTYSYDSVGNVTATTDANGHTSTSAYDTLRRLTSSSDALGNTTTYMYDSAGNRLTRTDANGVTTTYAYDSLNRLVSRGYSNGEPTVTFTYDAAGNQTQMTDGIGTTSYVYDSLKRLTQVTFPGPKTVAYQYDAAGNRTRLTYPDGKQATYAYDAANRLVSVTDWASRVTSYAYDNASRSTSMARSNGVTSSYSYDNASRLTGVTQLGGNISYTLDNVDNRLTRTQGSNTETYAYDNLYRLTGVQYAEGDCQTYAYDAVGNRLSLTATPKVTNPCDGTPSTTTYSYDAADRLVNEGARPYTFDKNGNQIGSGNDIYVYDAESRLVAIRGQPTATLPAVGSACADLNNDGTDNALDLSIMGKAVGNLRGQADFNFQADLNWDNTVNASDQNREGASYLQSCQGFQGSYTYDGDGRRVSKTENGTTTAYVWDVAAGLPVILQDSTSTSYEYGAGLILEEAAGTPTWYVQDGLGSTTGLANGAGALIDTYSYDAFGSVRLRTGASANDFTFTGQQADVSGLIYMRARQYDPILGRFAQMDPIAGSSDSSVMSTYLYAKGEPTTLVDPAGLRSFKFYHEWHWWGHKYGIVFSRKGVDYAAAQLKHHKANKDEIIKWITVGAVAGCGQLIDAVSKGWDKFVKRLVTGACTVAVDELIGGSIGSILDAANDHKPGGCWNIGERVPWVLAGTHPFWGKTKHHCKDNY